MIVKNESAVLPRCLNSVKLLVDEIIIVDTGSTDDTKAIAAAYTDLIFDFEWVDDFAAARNESLRHATGRWILVLDADEYVQSEDHDKLRDYLAGIHPSGPFGLTLPIVNFTRSGYDETQIMTSTGARLFINNHAIRYIEPIHEQLATPEGRPAFENYPFTLFHTGYTEPIAKTKQKSQRNLSILEKQSRTAKRQDPYFYFVLGNEYASATRHEEALSCYHSSYKGSKPTDAWFFHLLDRLIALEIEQGRQDKAYPFIKQLQKIAPDRTDAYCLEGILFESLGLLNASADVLARCISIAEEAEQHNRTYWSVQPTFGKIIPHRMLAEIKRKQGDLPAAVHHWIKLLRLQPKNYPVLQQLAEHLLQTEPADQVREILESLYPIELPVHALLLFKMSMNVGNAALVEHYGAELAKLDVRLDLQDSLMHDLFLHKNARSLPADRCAQASLSPTLAVAAAVVYENLDYADMASSDPGACRILARQLTLVLQSKDWDPGLVETCEDLFSQVLRLFWKCGYPELYMTLLQQAASGAVLNRMADWFYSTGQIDQAIDLYSILLDNQALSGEGLKTVGQWYLAAGNIEDGCSFVKASFDREPSPSAIGLLKEHASAQTYREFSPGFFHVYPHLSRCTFL